MRPKNPEKEAAIRATALAIIATDGLENLSMQRLAAEAGVSPRTIYIKYRDKEDLLITLFLDEVLVAYEAAVTEGLEITMDVTTGIRQIWHNMFRFFKNNKPAFALMQYGRSSPLLNRAFRERDIKEGQFFAAVHLFLKGHADAGRISKLPMQVYRALLFAPAMELIGEYFEHTDRPKQIITEKKLLEAADIVIKGILI